MPGYRESARWLYRVTRAGLPGPCVALVSVTFLLCLPPVMAQVSAAGLPGVRQGGAVFVEVGAIARALGVVAVVDGQTLTWRGPTGTVTLFGGSPDALASSPSVPAGVPSGGATANLVNAPPAREGAPVGEVALSAPVLVRSDGWFVPLDALPLFGIDPPADVRSPTELVLPGVGSLAIVLQQGAAGAPPVLALEEDPAAAGSAAPAPLAVGGADLRLREGPSPDGGLGWEVVGDPLAGVRFFGAEGSSVLLLDLALVPLAAPELTEAVNRALDDVAADGADRLLLLVGVTSDERELGTELRFEQADHLVTVEDGRRLVLVAGDPFAVSPGAPVAAAVLLPPEFNLYRPMTVVWEGVHAEVRFRR